MYKRSDCFDLIFRKTLEHGKHVLVDFPLSLTAQSGKELFSLAESKGTTSWMMIKGNYTCRTNMQVDMLIDIGSSKLNKGGCLFLFVCVICFFLCLCTDHTTNKLASTLICFFFVKKNSLSIKIMHALDQ